MKTKEKFELKGNGEKVTITLTGYNGGNFLVGRLFRVSGKLFDVVDKSGQAHRVSYDEISSVSFSE